MNYIIKGRRFLGGPWEILWEIRGRIIPTILNVEEYRGIEFEVISE